MAAFNPTDGIGSATEYVIGRAESRYKARDPSRVAVLSSSVDRAESVYNAFWRSLRSEGWYSRDTDVSQHGLESHVWLPSGQVETTFGLIHIAAKLGYRVVGTGVSRVTLYLQRTLHSETIGGRTYTAYAVPYTSFRVGWSIDEFAPGGITIDLIQFLR